MLDPSQANALVYSTLCGFMLIGLWAGYNTKNKREFISGVRTQSAWVVTKSMLTADMSSSLLQSYPQLALIPDAGLLGLGAYAFATIAPVWAFGYFGPLIRRVCPDGFTLSEYIRRRYGWPIGVFSALVFIGFMFCFMIVELNTYGSILATLQPNIPHINIIGPLIIAITTTIYTAYGGFKASLWTDNFNAVCVIVLIIIAGVMFGTRLPIDHAKVEESGLLHAQKLGGELWYILPVSITFAQMFNQGFWQRAFASKNNKSLYLSVALASLPLFAICFLVGMAGPLAQWAGVQDAPYMNPDDDTDDGSNALFKALRVMPNWVNGIVLVLAGVLSSSAYDTFQSAQISVIESDFFLGRLNIWWCRLILICLNVPCVALASINIDILEVFIVADLAALAIVPVAFLGLIPALYFFHGFDVVVGGCGGFLTVFVFGTIFYRDAKQGGALIGMPDGLYVSDYSVLGAFFAAPLGGLGFGLASCALRLGALYLFSKMTGRPFTALDRKHIDANDCVLPEDRPAAFFGLHGTGNPEDGRRLDDRAPDLKANTAEFHTPLHASGRRNWLGFRRGSSDTHVEADTKSLEAREDERGFEHERGFESEHDLEQPQEHAWASQDAHVWPSQEHAWPSHDANTDVQPWADSHLETPNTHASHLRAAPPLSAAQAPGTGTQIL